jgi:hypothetical protein
MIAPADDQRGVGHGFGNALKRFDHELQPFVCSPFAEGKNAVLGITAAGEIGIFRPCGQNSVRAQVHIFAAILFVKNLAVARHEHGDGIRQQQHPGGEGAGPAVSARVPHTCIVQIHCVHKVMQGNVRIATVQASQQGSKQSQKSIDRITAEGAEQQIEPDHIGFQLVKHSQETNATERVVEGPAAYNGKVFELGLIRGNPIGEDSDSQERIAPQFLGDVQAILA